MWGGGAAVVPWELIAQRSQEEAKRSPWGVQGIAAGMGVPAVSPPPVRGCWASLHPAPRKLEVRQPLLRAGAAPAPGRDRLRGPRVGPARAAGSGGDRPLPPVALRYSGMRGVTDAARGCAWTRGQRPGALGARRGATPWRGGGPDTRRQSRGAPGEAGGSPGPPGARRGVSARFHGPGPRPGPGPGLGSGQAPGPPAPAAAAAA